MANPKIIRKRNERRPVMLDVTYPEATALANLPVLFYMSEAGTWVPKVTAGAATKQDVSPAVAPQTVWRLSYAFTATDLGTLGKYLAEFEVDFGAGQKRYYPIGKEFVEVVVVKHHLES